MWARRKLGLQGASEGDLVPARARQFLNHSDPYAIWMSNNTLRPADVERLRVISPTMAFRPLVTLLLPVRVWDDDAQRTMCSVVAQIYDHWNLVIISPRSIRALNDQRVEVLHTASADGALACGLLASKGEFVGIVHSGDALAADALFQCVVALNRDQSIDMLYSDEDFIDELGRRSNPFFKPGWSPDSLLSMDYIRDFTLIRRSEAIKAGGYRSELGGAQQYDLALRVGEHSEKVCHLPYVLYHRSQQTKLDDSLVKGAITQALERRGEPGVPHAVERVPNAFIVRYHIAKPAKVSVIVPTRDHAEDLGRCLESVFSRTEYENFEVIVVDNGSRDAEVGTILENWRVKAGDRLRTLRLDIPFNYSRLNNVAVRDSNGDYVLFLNNDTEVLDADWMSALVEQAQRDSIGAVGAKLLYSDGTIQHAGVILGVNGVAAHSHRGLPPGSQGYWGQVERISNYAAVTGACMMVKRDRFTAVGGFDEALAVTFNDVDLCLRLLQAGYRNVYLPHVVLHHLESASRNSRRGHAAARRAYNEQRIMQARWGPLLASDPYYSEHLSRQSTDFTLNLEVCRPGDEQVPSPNTMTC